MADIKFRDTAHRDFFLENMMKCRVNDCYHRAFFYVMGIASETRANINQMFNFKVSAHFFFALSTSFLSESLFICKQHIHATPNRPPSIVPIMKNKNSLILELLSVLTGY